MNNTEKLNDAFAEGLSIPIAAVNKSLAYQGIAEWDSMAHMYLITALENKFEIAIETEDILEMTTYEKVQGILMKYNVHI